MYTKSVLKRKNMAKSQEIPYFSEVFVKTNPLETTITNYFYKKTMKTILSVLVICILFSLSACGSSELVYQGSKHPKTSNSKITFQEQNISESCFAFAHLIMNTRANSLGKDIADALRTEAMAKGADTVLVGLAREDDGAELDDNRFDYYGPEYSYNFNRTWLGWKFGFDAWNEGGKLIGFGTNASNSRETTFTNSMMIQAVFLRCNEQ